MYSIVIPLFNEEKTIPELCRRLSKVMQTLAQPVEVILVDDGSIDSTFRLLCDAHRTDARFKVLRLSRNFGHQIGITAGLELAQGDAVILMDGDLQDPPELIPSMVEQWKDGYQVVYTVKKTRKESFLKRAAFRSFYGLMRALSSIRIPPESGNFSLMDRRVIEVMRAMPERHRYISGMRAWIGFTQTGIEFDRDARFAGKPQMSIGRLIHLALDGIFSFSNVPLRLAVYVGLGSSMAAFAGGLFVIYEKLFTEKAILGWASTIVSILFLGGLILMTLGVIGEYLGRIYDEVKKRPLFVVRDRVGFDRSEPSAR